MIEIKNVSFSYGRRDSVLESLNLEMTAGNIYGLLGENGVGKTTLLKLISGLIFPNAGSLRVLGLDPRKRQAEFLRQVYFLPDTLAVEDMSMDLYVQNNACFYPNFDISQFNENISDLEVDRRKKMTKLSFGQQKKAVLAFALACNTPLLLMDEPTNGLDIPSKGLVRKLIARSLNEQKCYVISTHQVRDLEQLIDPIVIMEKQQILLNNTLAEITEKLWFGTVSEKPTLSLYTEDAVGGYYAVLPNSDARESKVNLEALFNAAIQNRHFFKENFINRKETK